MRRATRCVVVFYVDCWDHKENRPIYPTFRACLKFECNLSDEPYFGQCDAVPLAISAGALSLAYVLATFVLSEGGDRQAYLGLTGLLVAATFR